MSQSGCRHICAGTWEVPIHANTYRHISMPARADTCRCWHMPTLLGANWCQHVALICWDLLPCSIYPNPPFLITDVCHGSPCLNGGTCSHYVLGIQCQCAEGWTGHTCTEGNRESLRYAISTCTNGGTCNPHDLGIQCQCAKRWTGHACRECKRGHWDMFSVCVSIVVLVVPVVCNCAEGSPGHTCKMVTRRH